MRIEEDGFHQCGYCHQKFESLEQRREHEDEHQLPLFKMITLKCGILYYYLTSM